MSLPKGSFQKCIHATWCGGSTAADCMNIQNYYIRLVEAAGKLIVPQEQPKFLFPSGIGTSAQRREMSPTPLTLWRTTVFAPFPPLEHFHPFPVVCILEALGDELLGDEEIFVVAPIFTEVEMTGPTDVFFARGLLGTACAMAIGNAIPCLRRSLDSIIGVIPCREILVFHAAIRNGEESVPRTLTVGQPFSGETDPRFSFHEDLVERAAYLQDPYARRAFGE